MARPRVSITLDFTEFTTFVKDVKHSENAIRFESLGAARRVAEVGVATARLHSPKLSNRLHDSIGVTHSIVERGNLLIETLSLFADREPYDVVQEEGRAPNQKQPPVRVMERWVAKRASQGRFDLSRYKGRRKTRIRQAAFAVAASIGRQGTPALKYLDAGLDEMELLWGEEWEAIITRLYLRLLRPGSG